MFRFSIVGGLCGEAARAHPVAFVAFLSFGVVALLYLVCNELLIDARENLKGQEQWWSAMVLFLGVYSVLVLDLFLP